MTMAHDSECLNSFASGSKSQPVVPLSMLPGVAMAPDLCSNASASVVLPAAPCPTRAIERIASGQADAATAMKSAQAESVEDIKKAGVKL